MAVDETQPEPQSKTKWVVEGMVDATADQLLGGVINATAELMSGVSRAATTVADAANTALKVGGGGFGGGGATGGWELPSISLPDISLPDIDLPDIPL